MRQRGRDHAVDQRGVDRHRQVRAVLLDSRHRQHRNCARGIEPRKVACSEISPEKTFTCGALNYPLSKILNILDVDDNVIKPLSQEEIEQYKLDFNTVGSEIQKSYKKGQDVKDYAFDSKLFEMGRAGDMRAMKMFEEKRQKKKIQ